MSNTLNVTASQVIRPQVAPGSHPIETGRYIISTRAITLFFDTLREWIENHAPGGCVDSPPRHGKTWAIRFVSSLLKDHFGSIPIVTTLVRELHHPSDQNFLGQLLESVKHNLWNSGNANAKMHRLIEYLVAQVEESGQHRLIWFLDEAQFLHEPEYNTLINIHNELDARGITPIFILVGQPDLLGQIETFKTTGKSQILGRFMVQQFHFHGLTSSDDVALALTAYDEIEFPEGSGVSFTSYFFPDAYQLTDFRLKTYARDLWQAFQQIREESGIAVRQELPMQYFCLTVNHVLKTRQTSKLSPTISAVMWKEAIRASGYINAQRYFIPEVPNGD